MRNIFFNLLRLFFPPEVLFYYKMKAIKAVRHHIEVLMRDVGDRIDKLNDNIDSIHIEIKKQESCACEMDAACECIDDLLDGKK